MLDRQTATSAQIGVKLKIVPGTHFQYPEREVHVGPEIRDD